MSSPTPPSGDTPPDTPPADVAEEFDETQSHPERPERPERPKRPEPSEPEGSPPGQAPPPSDMFSSTMSEPPNEDWILTYADAITLLMAFFVMMFSISKVDPGKFEGMKKALAAEFGSSDAPAEPTETPPEPTPATVKTSDEGQSPGKAAGVLLDLAHGDARLAGMLSDVRKTDRGVVLEFGATTFFPPGSTAILPAARQALLALSFEFDPLVDLGHHIVIEGHTDPSPPGRGPLSNNWTLSAARAGAVVQFLVDQGIPANRLQAIGYADTKPLGKEKSADRRVAIRVEQDE